MEIKDIRTFMFAKIQELDISEEQKARQQNIAAGVCSQLQGLQFNATNDTYNDKPAIKIVFQTQNVFVKSIAKKINKICELTEEALFIY